MISDLATDIGVALLPLAGLVLERVSAGIDELRKALIIKPNAGPTQMLSPPRPAPPPEPPPEPPAAAPTIPAYRQEARLDAEMARWRGTAAGLVSSADLPERPVYSNDAELEAAREAEYEAFLDRCDAEAASWNAEARRWHRARADIAAALLQPTIDTWADGGLDEEGSARSSAEESSSWGRGGSGSSGSGSDSDSDEGGAVRRVRNPSRALTMTTLARAPRVRTSKLVAASCGGGMGGAADLMASEAGFAATSSLLALGEREAKASEAMEDVRLFVRRRQLEAQRRSAAERLRAADEISRRLRGEAVQEPAGPSAYSPRSPPRAHVPHQPVGVPRPGLELSPAAGVLHVQACVVRGAPGKTSSRPEEVAM